MCHDSSIVPRATIRRARQNSVIYKRLITVYQGIRVARSRKIATFVGSDCAALGRDCDIGALVVREVEVPPLPVGWSAMNSQT